MGGWVGGLGVIIKSNLNRVRLSCCWVVVGLGCDNKSYLVEVSHDRGQCDLGKHKSLQNKSLVTIYMILRERSWGGSLGQELP